MRLKHMGGSICRSVTVAHGRRVSKSDLQYDLKPELCHGRRTHVQR